MEISSAFDEMMDEYMRRIKGVITISPAPNPEKKDSAKKFSDSPQQREIQNFHENEEYDSLDHVTRHHREKIQSFHENVENDSFVEAERHHREKIQKFHENSENGSLLQFERHHSENIQNIFENAENESLLDVSRMEIAHRKFFGVEYFFHLIVCIFSDGNYFLFQDFKNLTKCKARFFTTSIMARKIS